MRYWDSIGNRRKAFIDFARSNNFDPKIAQNWYNNKDKLLGSQVFHFSFLFSFLFINNLIKGCNTSAGILQRKYNKGIPTNVSQHYY